MRIDDRYYKPTPLYHHIIHNMKYNTPNNNFIIIASLFVYMRIKLISINIFLFLPIKHEPIKSSFNGIARTIDQKLNTIQIRQFST